VTQEAATRPQAEAAVGVGPARVSAVIVTYREVDLTLEAIASLEAQTTPVYEVIVVDNDPGHSAREPLREAFPDVRLLNARNVGYAAGCNIGAAVASGDWLFFLNPDAAADPDCLGRLLAVASEHPSAGIVTPQVLFPDRERINAGENQIHLTGIAWCGRFGESPEDAPARPALITTGAAMLVRADLYRRLEGYCDDFFLYYEDPDICLRAWLVGAEVWYVPRARIIHHYSFTANNTKWFYLERHRLLSLLSTLRLSTLFVLAPLLMSTELALLVVARREGWLTEKIRAYRSVWQARGWIRRRRAKFAEIRTRPDAAIIERFQARVDSPQIASDVGRRVAPLLVAYRAVAVALVKTIGR
jgi:GT2 family glycosyltransferase